MACAESRGQGDLVAAIRPDAPELRYAVPALRGVYAEALGIPSGSRGRLAADNKAGDPAGSAYGKYGRFERGLGTDDKSQQKAIVFSTLCSLDALLTHQNAPFGQLGGGKRQLPQFDGRV